ncbi:3-methyl-2-oxobutanoate hydroxymethyltransferase [Gemmatirosa kalamazoonensis]|jgi:3-methyl-2-oxobutanoate hydroxymethyltransferase|uniref:3-methyl-2-oxobutanoate hydroxymethyltransferase n=1 Tax=Gemmatirosa kalamazoonensis TaxID=861299 RepID=W0RJ42_9BACT|nr:3-methyl-2-oxobutanoate hydroxymethyltransferase [Gemmatirosa kalamazoonensis]AHG89433.1 3-methyl-2-oxobutanoate hydroxymethyltransferase [Gemmatirosa kalamazoonensis]
MTAPVTTGDLAAMKRRGDPIVMVTAYDHVTARVAESAGVDAVLVGDSAAMTVLGYPSTREIGVDELLVLTRAVRRGLVRPLLVGDLPYASYEASDAQALGTARRFVDAGCAAVKMEGAGPIADRARALVRAGIPVMGHVGLTPQASAGPEGYRVRGATADEVLGIRRDVDALVDAGCFAIVFEAIPAAVAALLVPAIPVPVIGIGAGPATDGQVLVFHDLVGLSEGRAPRFVKRYAALGPLMVDAVARYAAETRAREFPAPEHTYRIPAAELEAARVAIDGAAAT